MLKRIIRHSVVLLGILVLGCSQPLVSPGIESESSDSPSQVTGKHYSENFFQAFLIEAAFVLESQGAQESRTQGTEGTSGIFGLGTSVQVGTSPDVLFSVSTPNQESRSLSTLTAEERAEVEKVLAGLSGLPVDQVLSHPTVKQYFPDLSVPPSPAASPSTQAVLSEIFELSTTGTREQLMAYLQSVGLYQTYLKVEQDFEGKPPSNARSLSSAFSDVSEHYYKYPLNIRFDSLQHGDIFLVSGPNHENGITGDWGHGGIFDKNAYDPANKAFSRCVWSANGTMTGTGTWPYIVRNSDGSPKSGVYSEYLGKYMHEYAIVVLRPKNNTRAASALDRARSLNGEDYGVTGFKYQRGDFICTEVVGYAWTPYTRVENAYSWNALDYVWPMDIYDAYKYDIYDWEWVVTWYGIIPTTEYKRVRKSGPTLDRIQITKQGADGSPVVIWKLQ